MSSRAVSQAMAVLSYIRAQGEHGATIEEAATALGLRLASVCGRCSDLQGDEAAGVPARIRDSGQRRATTSGSLAKVWVAV